MHKNCYSCCFRLLFHLHPQTDTSPRHSSTFHHPSVAQPSPCVGRSALRPRSHTCVRASDAPPCGVLPSDASRSHPYENPKQASSLPDLGYGCKMVNGVMHVYTERNVMEKWVFSGKEVSTIVSKREGGGLDPRSKKSPDPWSTNLFQLGCCCRGGEGLWAPLFTQVHPPPPTHNHAPGSESVSVWKRLLVTFRCFQQNHRAGPSLPGPTGIHRWHERHDGPHHQWPSVSCGFAFY